ncbi:hypothetical protein ACQR3P_31100, partial [Rhodococcus sp. IEGM1300]
FGHQPRHHHQSVGVWLASDGDLENAITGKPVSYGFVFGHQPRHHHQSVGVWLASDGDFGIAITGKPASYSGGL